MNLKMYKNVFFITLFFWIALLTPVNAKSDKEVNFSDLIKDDRKHEEFLPFYETEKEREFLDSVEFYDVDRKEEMSLIEKVVEDDYIVADLDPLEETTIDDDFIRLLKFSDVDDLGSKEDLSDVSKEILYPIRSFQITYGDNKSKLARPLNLDSKVYISYIYAKDGLSLIAVPKDEGSNRKITLSDLKKLKYPIEFTSRALQDINQQIAKAIIKHEDVVKAFCFIDPLQINANGDDLRSNKENPLNLILKVEQAIKLKTKVKRPSLKYKNDAQHLIHKKREIIPLEETDKQNDQSLSEMFLALETRLGTDQNIKDPVGIKVDGTLYPVQSFQIEIKAQGSKLPSLLEIERGVLIHYTALKGREYLLAIPKDGGSKKKMTLEELNKFQYFVEFSADALQSVSEQIVQIIKDKGILGASCRVDPNQINSKGEDLRPNQGTPLRLIVSLVMIGKAKRAFGQ